MVYGVSSHYQLVESMAANELKLITDSIATTQDKRSKRWSLRPAKYPSWTKATYHMNIPSPSYPRSSPHRGGMHSIRNLQYTLHIMKDSARNHQMKSAGNQREMYLAAVEGGIRLLFCYGDPGLFFTFARSHLGHDDITRQRRFFFVQERRCDKSVLVADHHLLAAGIPLQKSRDDY